MQQGQDATKGTRTSRGTESCSQVQGKHLGTDQGLHLLCKNNHDVWTNPYRTFTGGMYVFWGMEAEVSELKEKPRNIS